MSGPQIRLTNQRYVMALYVVGATAVEGLYRSTDGAQTWERLTSPAGTLLGYVCAISPDIALVQSDASHLYRTADAGQTWADVYTGAVTRISMADANVGWGVGGSSGHLVKTTDGGRTWADIDLSGIIGATALTDVKALSPTLAYACGNVYATTSKAAIVKTTDGVAWTLQTSGYNYPLSKIDSRTDGLKAVACGGHTVAGSGGALYTTDGGTTWTAATGEPETCVDIACVGNMGRILTTGGGIYRSVDGGATYTAVSDRPAVAIATYQDRHVWIAHFRSTTSYVISASPDGWWTWADVVTPPVLVPTEISACAGYMADGPAITFDIR